MPDSARHVHRPSTSLPILGVLPELVRRRRDLHNLFARYAAEARAAGKPLVNLSYGPLHRMLLVAEPLVADEILRSPDFTNRTSFAIIDAIYAQFAGLSRADPNMGGITFVNGAVWRRNRLAAQRILSSADFLDRARRETETCAARLIASWRTRGLINSGAPVDLGLEMSRLAIDVMGRLCWQTDLHAISGVDDGFLEPVRTMLDAIQRYIYVPLPAWILAKLPTPALRRLRAAVRRLRSTGDALLAVRFDETGRLNPNDTRDDVLAFLLRELAPGDAPGKPELDNVQATLMDLLGAGHDTTANALSFCLGLLAQPAHARWQERAAAEARQSEAGASGATGAVLAAVYRETLRLYPLGAMFSRVCSANTTLDPGGGDPIPIAAGTQMFVSPYVMGRDPREWKDAAQFQPERHFDRKDPAPGGCPQLTRLRIPAYAPYGGGTRVCVGAQFAEIEAHTALSRILSGFRLHLLQGDAPIEADLLFTMRPRRPLYVRIENR